MKCEKAMSCHKPMTSRHSSCLHDRVITLHLTSFHIQAESVVEVTCQYMLFGYSLHYNPIKRQRILLIQTHPIREKSCHILPPTHPLFLLQEIGITGRQKKVMELFLWWFIIHFIAEIIIRLCVSR